MDSAEIRLSHELALLRRGACDLVTEAELEARLLRSQVTEKPLSVKAGFDPTAQELHLGHTVLFRKMRHFQQLGHRVIFLIGDFTARIGDPSGRKSTRPQLEREEIERNAARYTEQVFRYLDAERTVIARNSTWLDALGAEGLIRLAGRWTLARMLEREDFRTRFAEHQPIALHELLYPLVQGWDSVAMARMPDLGCDVELGGHDQIFNLLVGRDLMREEGLEPQICLTVPLLLGIDGKEKMSKSLGNAIGLEDRPSEVYGRTMSIPDLLMWDWFLLLTDIPESELTRWKQEVASGERHPKGVKQELARRLTTELHGAQAAAQAEAEFERIFAQGAAPEAAPELRSQGPVSLLVVLRDSGLVTSGNEVRRLLRQNGIELDGEVLSEAATQLELGARLEPYLIRVGKRRFLRLFVS